MEAIRIIGAMTVWLIGPAQFFITAVIIYQHSYLAAWASLILCIVTIYPAGNYLDKAFLAQTK